VDNQNTLCESIRTLKFCQLLDLKARINQNFKVCQLLDMKTRINQNFKVLPAAGSEGQNQSEF